MNKNILIIKGGFSSEADVSRDTAKNVEKALISKGYKTKSIEADKKLIPFLLKNKKEIDVIFNALHGPYGEDGKIQGLFEYMKIPYTHSGVKSSAIGMDKYLSKKIFMSNRILVPKGKLLSKKQIIKKDPFERPFIVKPISEGSSLDINLIKKNTRVRSVLNNKNLNNYLVEEYIPGTDLTVAILRGKALGLLEVITNGDIYSYNDKYRSKSTKYVIPKKLNKITKANIFSAAEKSYKALSCNSLARVDFRINKKIKNNNFYMLEVNTQPGLTLTSLYPKIAKSQGIDFVDLVEFIINDAGLNK